MGRRRPAVLIHPARPVTLGGPGTHTEGDHVARRDFPCEQCGREINLDPNDYCDDCVADTDAAIARHLRDIRESA